MTATGTVIEHPRMRNEMLVTSPALMRIPNDIFLNLVVLAVA
jgi:hypothetical protein